MTKHNAPKRPNFGAAQMEVPILRREVADLATQHDSLSREVARMSEHLTTLTATVIEIRDFLERVKKQAQGNTETVQ